MNWVSQFLERNDISRRPVVRRSRYSTHFGLPGGMEEVYFTGQPQYYRDNDGVMKPIEKRWARHGSEYGAPWSQVRIAPDGSLCIQGSEYAQHGACVGLYDPAARRFRSLVGVPPGRLQGGKMVAETGIYRREQILTETGLREDLVLAGMPPAICDETDLIGITCEIHGATWPDGPLGPYWSWGKFFPAPRAQDARGRGIPCQRFAFALGGRQHVFTGVAAGFLQDAVFPVTIDPDFTGHTNDGNIIGMDNVYANARANVNGFDTTDNGLAIGQDFSTPTYVVYRAFIKFNTAAIADNDSVAKAQLGLTVITDESATDFDAQIVAQDWSAQDPIAAGNQEAAYDNCLSGSLDTSIWRNTAGIAQQQYFSGELTTSRVSKTGYTYYSMRSSRDKNSNTPAGKEYVYVGSAQAYDPAQYPVLRVVLASMSAFLIFL